jgi:hypothetical protein
MKRNINKELDLFKLRFFRLSMKREEAKKAREKREEAKRLQEEQNKKDGKESSSSSTIISFFKLTLPFILKALVELGTSVAFVLANFLMAYMMDLVIILSNAFLMMKSYYYLEDLDKLQDQVTEVAESLKDAMYFPFLKKVVSAWETLFQWLSNVDFNVIAFKGMDVTCEGAQAPGKLFINLLLFIGLATLIETQVYYAVRIPLKAWARSKAQFWRNLDQPQLRLLGFTLFSAVAGFEGLFKYLMQLFISLSKVADFFPVHKSTGSCDYAASNADTALAVISTLIITVFFIPTLHFLLKIFVPGMPKGIQFRDKVKLGFSAWFRRVVLRKDKKEKIEMVEFAGGEKTLKKRLGGISDKDLEFLSKLTRSFNEEDDQTSIGSPSTGQQESTELSTMSDEDADTREGRSQLRRSSSAFYDRHMQEKDAFPAFSTIFVAVLSEAWDKDMTTLRDYGTCMWWKTKQLFKISFGYWDKDTLRAFSVIENANKWDEDPLDDEEYHGEIVSIIGTSHTLIWQFTPMTLFLSKLAESVNKFPVFVKTDELKLADLMITKEIHDRKKREKEAKEKEKDEDEDAEEGKTGTNEEDDEDKEEESPSFFGRVKEALTIIYENYAESRGINFVYEVTKFVFTCLIVFVPSELLFLVIIFTVAPKNISKTVENLKNMDFDPQNLRELIRSMQQLFAALVAVLTGEKPDIEGVDAGDRPELENQAFDLSVGDPELPEEEGGEIDVEITEDLEGVVETIEEKKEELEEFEEELEEHERLADERKKKTEGSEQEQEQEDSSVTKEN